MSEEEQIEKLKKIALDTQWTDVEKKVIDALEAYGEKGIVPITEIIERTTWTDLEKYGLETIKRIKEKKEGEGVSNE